MFAIITAGEPRFAQMLKDLADHAYLWSQHPAKLFRWSASQAVLNDLADFGQKVPHLRVGFGR